MNPINGLYEASARTHSPRPSAPPATALPRFSYDMASIDLLPGAMSQEEVQEVTETQSAVSEAKRAAARQRAAERAAEALEEYVPACLSRYANRRAWSRLCLPKSRRPAGGHGNCQSGQANARSVHFTLLTTKSTKGAKPENYRVTVLVAAVHFSLKLAIAGSRN